jgi:HSP20 family protein
MTRYEPFRGVVPLGDALNQLFNESFALPRPAGRTGAARSSLYETKEAFILQVALPGVRQDAVELTLREDLLTLTAKRTLPAPEGARALWAGLGSAEYTQSYSLPAPVNAEATTADLTDGILTLTMPKAEHAKARQIKINAAA